MLREGQQLGQYHLHHLLGSGGMGEVYLAEDRRLGRQVAIKVIHSQPLASPESESAKEAQRLFEREARAIARLDHPNILPLYAYGEESIHDDLLIYLVMPYRKEGTLASWLRRRQSSSPLSPAAFAPWLAQAATALEHAHQQGVIHQDVKPTNFLLRLNEEHPDRPDLLLADFGIAKLSHATASSSQSIRGTPTHMAPEQWDGHPLPATDQYALAIMAYEVLVGRPPFQGHPAQVMRQHYQTPPPVPSSLNPELSSAVDAVLLRALSKQSDDRFPSMTAFARAFQDAVHFQGEREERESEPNMQNAPTILPQAQPPQSTIAREEKSMRSVPASEVAAAEMEPIPPTVLAHQPFSAERTTRQPMTSPGKTSALFPREPGHIEGSTTPIQPNTHRRSRRLVLVGLAAVLLVALISANYLFPHAKPLTHRGLPVRNGTPSRPALFQYSLLAL